MLTIRRAVPASRDGSFALGVPRINTRRQYADVRNPIARKGQGTKSLAGSKGSAPCVPPINTRAQYADVRNSIARMGVQRVEDPLAESRGSASGSVLEGKSADESGDMLIVQKNRQFAPKCG